MHSSRHTLRPPSECGRALSALRAAFWLHTPVSGRTLMRRYAGLLVALAALLLTARVVASAGHTAYLPILRAGPPAGPPFPVAPTAPAMMAESRCSTPSLILFPLLLICTATHSLPTAMEP